MLRPMPRPPPFVVERDDDRRPVVALDQARGDDPDDARMPALAGDDEPGASRRSLGQLAPGRLGGRVDLPLGRPPLGVGPAQLGGDRLARAVVLGQHQLDPGVGPVEAPGGVDPRRQPEGEVALVEPLRLAFRDRHQRPQPGPVRAAHLREPAPDQRPVLADQRDDVGDRGERDEVEVA